MASLFIVDSWEASRYQFPVALHWDGAGVGNRIGDRVGGMNIGGGVGNEIGFGVALFSVEVESVVVTMQDLTPLEELERLRAEFLGVVSHELRTPLVSIKQISADSYGPSVG